MTVVTARVGSDTALSTELRLRLAAAAAAALAAVIHLWVVPEHLAEWWVYGTFFLAVTALQGAQVWSLLRGPRLATLLLGIWGTVALLAVYVASRTVGLPVSPPGEAGGHEGGHAAHLHHLPVAGGVGSGTPVIPSTSPEGVEGVGPLDMAALGLELALVLLLVSLLPNRHRRMTVNALYALGVAVWVGRAAFSFA